MRKAKSSAAAGAILSWSPATASGNLVDPPYYQVYTLTNTGTAAATSLAFSSHIFAGSFDSTTPGNEGDVPAGNFIYISAHDCGTSLAAGQSCSVTFHAYSMNNITIHDICTATGGGSSATLTNLTYDPSI